MLGIILSETAEVVYTIIKLSWSGGTSIYNWYYGEESEETKSQPVDFSRASCDVKKSGGRRTKTEKPEDGPSRKSRGFRKRRGKPAAARPFSVRNRRNKNKSRQSS